MLISVTHFQLRSLWHLPQFIRWAHRCEEQLRKAPGMLASRKTATSPRNFWTLTAWEDETCMRDYRNQGDHLDAMRAGPDIASALESISFEAEQLPPWPDAMARLHDKYGRR